MRQDLQLYAKMATNGLGYVAGQVEVCSACGQKCKYCFSRDEHLAGTMRGTWKLEQLIKLLDELDEIPTFEHLAFTGGDPIVYPYLAELLAHVRAERAKGRYGFSLQANTALTLDPKQPELWSEFRDLRVSLDGVEDSFYQEMRGVQVPVATILERCRALDHPRLAFNATIGPANIIHAETMLNKMIEWKESGWLNFRKFNLLPVLGHDNPPWMWAKWKRLNGMEWPEWISLGSEARPPLEPNTRCWVPKITFHMKANGDVYPCCLAGGEALQTQTEFCMGNWWNDGIHVREYAKKWVAQKLYAAVDGQPSVCWKICQWKQATFNQIAEEASQVQLAMP